MNAATESSLKGQLLDRRQRMQEAIAQVGPVEDLVRLLREVDSALSRMDARTYGVCEVCKESVDEKDLLANPLIRYCLCDLTPEQQRELETDLDLARRIQAALLPPQDVHLGGWQVHYRYEPHGHVSGDYCDVLMKDPDAGEIVLAIGDVSGKGVSASLLMAHLNASFRSLIDVGLSVHELVGRSNRLLLESSIASHYATLVCCRTRLTGEVEICNAGHVPPLVVRGGRVDEIGSTGFPIGMVAERAYSVRTERLAPGDTLFLYTDGLTEARGRGDEEYGLERLRRVVVANRALPPRALAGACLADLASFASGTPRADDLTLMVVRRTDGAMDEGARS